MTNRCAVFLKICILLILDLNGTWTSYLKIFCTMFGFILSFEDSGLHLDRKDDSPSGADLCTKVDLPQSVAVVFAPQRN